MEPSKTDLNLWMAFSDESKTHRLYTAYAQQAMNEGNHAVAQAFMEAAGSEVVHALAALKALGTIKSSADNLRRVIDEEAHEAEVTYPRYIKEAREEGRADAEAAFRLALERERYHTELFRKALETIGDGRVAPQSDATPAQAPPEAALAKTAVPTHFEGERKRIASRSRIRELVFGAQDGILTTVGVVSSVFGATEKNSIILLAGLASGFAGMVAMTAGSYLSSKAEIEVQRSEISRESSELREHPEEELVELIEIYRMQGMPAEQARDAALRVAKNPRKMLRVMAESELGIEINPTSSPMKDAGVMALSFLCGAVLPILPYVFLHGIPALALSIVLAVVALFGVGVIKARVVDANIWRAGLETFAIGAAAALLGFVLGTLIPKAFGVNFLG